MEHTDDTTLKTGKSRIKSGFWYADNGYKYKESFIYALSGRKFSK